VTRTLHLHHAKHRRRALPKTPLVLIAAGAILAGSATTVAPASAAGGTSAAVSSDLANLPETSDVAQTAGVEERPADAPPMLPLTGAPASTADDTTLAAPQELAAPESAGAGLAPALFLGAGLLLSAGVVTLVRGMRTRRA